MKKKNKVLLKIKTHRGLIIVLCMSSSDGVKRYILSLMLGLAWMFGMQYASKRKFPTSIRIEVGEPAADRACIIFITLA